MIKSDSRDYFILFQLIWTFYILKKLYHGFHENNDTMHFLIKLRIKKILPTPKFWIVEYFFVKWKTKE